MKNLLKFTSFLLLISLLMMSCKKDIQDDDSNQNRLVNSYDYKIVHEWNQLFLTIERFAEGYRPGPAPHAIGYWTLACYEACISGMPNNNSMANRYADLRVPTALNNQEYHWPSVVNAASNFLFSRFFPHVRNDREGRPLYPRINQLFLKNERDFLAQTTPEIYLRSKNHGEAVAAAFWEWMRTDTELFEAYQDPFKGNFWQERTELFAWQPTFPGPGDGMFPYWGKGRPMAIPNDLKLCRHYRHYVGELSEDPSSAFYMQAREVMAQNTPSLAFTSKWVGEFWSDDLLELTFSPPSRFLAIPDQVYVLEKATLEQALEANARVGMALHDAAIGAWNSKYFYNLERPVSYINRNIDPTWKPNLDNPLTGEQGISPSFPAYPSGHATFGGAGAEALAGVFGYRYSMTDRCHENRNEFFGMPRTFGSFFEMAHENAWSRVPLGVHYRMDSDEGLRYGTEIGRVVNRLPWRK